MHIRVAPEGPTTRTVVIRGVAAIFLALLVNVTLLTIVLQGGVVPRFRPLDYTSVVTLTTLGVLGATVVYWLLVQWKPEPDRLFAWIAGILLVVSFLPDIGLLYIDPQATVPGVLVLMGMHVIAAIVAVGMLTDPLRG